MVRFAQRRSWVHTPVAFCVPEEVPVLVYILLLPLIVGAQIEQRLAERADRARRAWLAERAAYLEAGWEWDGEA